MFTLVGCTDVGNSENVGVNENVVFSDVYTNISNATFTPLEPIGEIPDYITIDGQQFSTALTELDLYALNVTNKDIELLQYMTKLERLMLFSFLDSDLTPLTNIPSLVSLTLSGTPNDITPLSDLVNLESLFWEHNWADDLTPLSSLTNLRRLTLEIPEVRDLSPLSELVSLEDLFFAGHQIEDLTPLSTLQNLTSLTILSDNLTDITPLRYLENLRYLDLRGSHQVDDTSAVEHVENVFIFVR